MSPVIARRQLPVATPLSAADLLHAGRAALGRSSARGLLAGDLGRRFDAQEVALADSGTSALVLALRAAVGAGGTVAFPGYACVDLAAAALFAGVHVRLYDVDPATLSPDLASLDRALERGADAVVVVHLYGYPADMDGVLRLAAKHEVPVIEDAAQAAAGSLHGRRLGAMGALSVLSFGRGKGLGGGGGGALLARDHRLAGRIAEARGRFGAAGSEWRALAVTAAAWALGRPSVYAVPSSIPALRLGEMVYHPAHEPQRITSMAATLVTRALERERRELMRRTHVAGWIHETLRGADDLVPVSPIAGAAAGYLRVAVLDRGGRREPAPALGVLRGYPLALCEQPELAPQLHPGEGRAAGATTPGAIELARTLLTVPTHGMVGAADRPGLAAWLRAGAASPAVATAYRFTPVASSRNVAG